MVIVVTEKVDSGALAKILCSNKEQLEIHVALYDMQCDN